MSVHAKIECRHTLRAVAAAIFAEIVVAGSKQTITGFKKSQCLSKHSLYSAAYFACRFDSPIYKCMQNGQQLMVFMQCFQIAKEVTFQPDHKNHNCQLNPHTSTKKTTNSMTKAYTRQSQTFKMTRKLVQVERTVALLNWTSLWSLTRYQAARSKHLDDKPISCYSVPNTRQKRAWKTLNSCRIRKNHNDDGGNVSKFATTLQYCKARSWALLHLGLC